MIQSSYKCKQYLQIREPPENKNITIICGTSDLKNHHHHSHHKLHSSNYLFNNRDSTSNKDFGAHSKNGIKAYTSIYNNTNILNNNLNHTSGQSSTNAETKTNKNSISYDFDSIEGIEVYVSKCHMVEVTIPGDGDLEDNKEILRNEITSFKQGNEPRFFVKYKGRLFKLK